MDMNHKITVIGRGMNSEQHLTLAGVRALREAGKVIGIEPETAAWLALREEFQLPAVEDISHLYRPDSRDVENYERFVARALELSAEHPRLALLVAGHPRLGVSFLQTLPARLPAGTELEVIEGISSFDVLLNDLALDPIERGTAMIDVNRMLLFRYELEPATAAFFYHVCSVANSVTTFDSPEKNGRLSLLSDYLQKFYPANKEIFLCRASNGPSFPATRTALKLSELAGAAAEIDFSSTLFVPPELPTKLDREFLALL
jgi:uncharacterized protein YabN with tetrapyrrole methylase and pyrophosphatase domain